MPEPLNLNRRHFIAAAGIGALAMTGNAARPSSAAPQKARIRFED